ncbi:ATP-dependent DNA ligase, partial [Actinoplanes octamycinicus]
RSAAAPPASYVVFDLLQVDGHELVDRPLLERRMLLEELCDGLAGITVCPATRDPDEARGWFDEYSAAGCEGIVIKDLTSRYRAGAPGWWKWKRRTTTEALVGGVVGSPRDPVALLLGRYAGDGTLRFVGRTVVLTAAQRAGLAPELRPAGTSWWPQPLPAAWTWKKPQAYEPVEPVVVEIAVDEAFEQGRWRHPVRYLRVRAELHPSQLPLWTPDGDLARPMGH